MLRLSRLTFLASALAVSALLSIGCGGDDGTTGPQGPAGPPGTAGDKGDKGDPGESTGNTDPQVSLVTPGTVYLNRRVDVTIAGDNTKWDDSVDVDFGPGITVDGLFVTPASIIASITIDETAEIGFHDVVVSGPDGMMPITYPEAMLVAPPIFVPGAAGTLAQGSIFISRIHLEDMSTPFDSAGSPDYPYLTVTSAAGIEAQVQEATPFTIDLLTFVDVDGTTGEVDFRVTSGLTGLETESLAPKALPISARSPVALVEGQPNSGTVMAPLETLLYSFTPSAPGQIITIESTSADPSATPAFALLPSTGRFADLISYGTTGSIATQTVDPIYIVVWDNTGASGYSFDISISSKQSDEVEPNDACDKAQAVPSFPAALTNLSLSGQLDEDWFVIDAAAGDVGKVIHAVTTAGDPNTDTYIDVFSGTCQNLSSLGGPSSDADYHEDFTSKPIPAAGKIYVKVSNSPFYPFAGSVYNLNLDLVQTEVEPNSTCGEASNVASLPFDIQGASLADASDEDWYAITIGAGDVGKLLQVETTPGQPNTDTYLEVFSGDCANLVNFAASSDLDYHEALLTTPLPAAGTYFVKISASSFGFAGTDYNFSIKAVQPAETEPNNTCNEANAGLMLGADVGPIYMADNTDEDWFSFMAAAGDVGKTVHVVTKGGDLNTDTVVEVFEGDCMTLTSLGVSDDSDYHENLVSAPITAAGPIYVKVSYTQLYPYEGDEYQLNVVLE